MSRCLQTHIEFKDFNRNRDVKHHFNLLFINKDSPALAVATRAQMITMASIMNFPEIEKLCC